MSEPIRFRCPCCYGKLSSPPQRAGKTCNCPKCEETITIPTPEEAEAASGSSGSLARTIMEQVEAIEQENRELESKLDEELQERLKMEAAREKLEGDLDRMRTACDQLAEAETRAKAEGQRLQTELSEAKAELETTRSAVAGLENRCHAIERERDKAQQRDAERLKTAEAELERRATLLEETRQERTYLQETLESTQDEISLLRRRQEPLQAENRRLQETLQEQIAKHGDGADDSELVKMREENHALALRLEEEQQARLLLEQRLQEAEVQEPASVS